MPPLSLPPHIMYHCTNANHIAQPLRLTISDDGIQTYICVIYYDGNNNDDDYNVWYDAMWGCYDGWLTDR